LSAQSVANGTNFRTQACGNYFFDWGRGVKIMKATFRGVHKSVNKKHTLLDLVSEYNEIMM